MPDIYTVTVNPAIDMILYLKKFEPEITNRLTDTREWLGGKGTHVSLNLRAMGLESTALGIAHGDNGRKVIRFLEERGIRTAFQQYEGAETRTNYLIIEEDGKSTTLSSRGKMLTDEDIDSFIRFLRQYVRKGDWLILSGDASNCPDPYVNNTIIRELKDLELKVFLDASGETLRRSAEACPYMIKPNRDELAYLTGLPTDTEEQILAAVASMDIYRIPVIAVSLGGDGSLVKNGEDLYRVYSPKVHVGNTIGCGDCFLSGLVYGLMKELPFEETLRIAAASSAATAESYLSVGYDTKRAEELKSEVKIVKL